MVTNSGFGQVMEEGDNPGFFKILRKEYLQFEITRMIPYQFIQSMSGNSSFKMVLKVPWGSSWPIKICKNPSFCYMEDHGWNQFVNDNDLGENEYLTFTHEANMCFNVNIFDSDGKEILKPRKSTTIGSSSGLEKREQRKNMYSDVKKEEITFSSKSSPSLETEESSGGRLKQKHELNLRNKKAKQTEISKNKKNHKKMTKVDAVCNNHEAGTSSLFPGFNLTIKKSHLLFLGVPKRFVEMHMPKETTTFKIHNPIDERTWEVVYLVTDAQSRFSAGWSRLAKDLGLEVGDFCTFKLVKHNEMLIKVSNE